MTAIQILILISAMILAQSFSVEANGQTNKPKLLPQVERRAQQKEKTDSERLAEGLRPVPLGKQSIQVKGGPDHNQILQQQWSREVDQRRHQEIQHHNQRRIPTH